MNKRNVFIGIAVAALITALVLQLYDFNPDSNNDKIIFIKKNGIESINDLKKIEELTNKTILVNMWNPDSDNCLYSTEKGKSELTDLEILHVFSLGNFSSDFGYKRFVKKKQVQGKYLLLPSKDYINLVKEISLSKKGTKGTYPIQFFVREGKIIEINKNNKEYLSAFHKK